MTIEGEMPEENAPYLITRRALVAGMLIAAAAPSAMARVWTKNGILDIKVRKGEGLVPLIREFHTSTQSSFGTVIAGGYRFGALSSVQIFDGQNWRNAPPLLTPRYKHAAVAYIGGVLVIGGLSSAGNTLSDAEYFDGNGWVRAPSMRIPRELHAVVLMNGLPIVTGGKNRQPLSSVEVFDGTNWQQYPSLNTPRYGHTAAVENGAPIVRGGVYLAPLTSAESFNGIAWTRRGGGNQSTL